MTWRSNYLLCVCIILSGCSHKVTKEIQTEEHHLADISKMVSSDVTKVVVDCVFIAPIPLLWGDSVTVPPLPPAPSFHYVCLADSVPPPRPRPVYVRKTITTSKGDSVVTQEAKVNHWDMEKSQTREKGRSHWWVYVLIFLFVDVLGLFVYFVWRFGRN